MNLNIKGEILRVGDTQQVTGNFKKRDLILKETIENYPQTYKIEFLQDNCKLLDNLKKGHLVEVSVNLRGREYTNKKTGLIDAFNSIVGWKIENQEQEQRTQTKKVENNNDTIEGDDLPF